jgi:hypothetical protein
MTGRCCKSRILRDIARQSAASTIAQNHKLLRENPLASAHDLKPRFQALPKGDGPPAPEARIDDLQRESGRPTWE